MCLCRDSWVLCKIVLLTIVLSYLALSIYLLVDFQGVVRDVNSEKNKEEEVIYDGVSYTSTHELILAKKEEKIKRFWVPDILNEFPYLVLQILLAIVAACFGSLCGSLKNYLTNKPDIKVFSHVLLGGFVGMLTFFIAKGVPFILIEGSHDISSGVVLILSVMNGMFPDYMIEGIETFTKRIWARVGRISS